MWICKGSEDTCFPCKCSSKVNSAKEFSNQVDRMAYSGDSQPLSLAILVIAQWPHEQNGYDGIDGGYAWAQQYRLSLTKPDLATAASE